MEGIRDTIKENDLLSSHLTQGLSLRNSFSSIIATKVQQDDLLYFRNIGHTDLEKWIKRTYLGVHSKEVLGSKQHRLSTFSTAKPTKRQYNQLLKEKSLVTSCLKIRLLYCSNTNKKASLEQYLEVPRALADHNGMPHKGQKSSTTAFFSSKYQGTNVILDAYPSGWKPDSVILEGMFMIDTTPLRIHSCMLEYVRFLMYRHVYAYICVGVKEIHIVFDDPGRFNSHPKDIERGRRDTGTLACNEHHTFSDTMKIPKKME